MQSENTNTIQYNTIQGKYNKFEKQATFQFIPEFIASEE